MRGSRGGAAIFLPLGFMLGLVLVSASVMGCGGSVAAKRGTAIDSPVTGDGVGSRSQRPGTPAPVAVVNWEAFGHTSAALDQRVRAVAEDLRSSHPVRSAAELASLRLVQRGRDLVMAGRADSAIDLLERSLAMWGRNGFADVYLGYAHHQLGRPRTALGFAERAGQGLPPDARVRGELQGLTRSIQANSPGSLADPPI